MSLGDLAGTIDEQLVRDRSKWIGVYVGILASLLALCGMGSGDAARDAVRLNIDMSDTYAFYQAKNIRQINHQLAADQLDIMLKTATWLTPEGRAGIVAKLSEYKTENNRLETDATKGEGKAELLAKAGAMKKGRDLALSRDPYFSWGQTLLQISIVLASISIITGGMSLLWVSGVLGIGGTVLLINAFTLWFKFPFVA